MPGQSGLRIAPDPLGMPMVRPAPMVPDAAARSSTMMVPGEVAVAGGHELLWLAAVARMPLAFDVARHTAGATRAVRGLAAATPLAEAEVRPAEDAERPLVEERQAAPAGLVDPRAAMWFDAPAAPRRQAGRLPRWSGDGWLLMRRGGNRAGPASVLLPSYGANQLGAVLRYRLDPDSAHRPTGYVRAYAALNGTGEREVAAGLSARPLSAVPVAAMAEGRVSRFMGGSSHVRPAVALVTELPPAALPGALRAETYVQAGYVGGTGATAFVDGQFRLERVVHHAAHVEVRLGGGAWGGAQKGAQRMDVGPTATLAFSTARAGAHLSFDWRLRVAGNAQPGSGPAVTLAAGF